MSEKSLPLKVMRDRVARFVQDTGSYRATRIDDVLNDSLQKAKEATDWSELLRVEESTIQLADNDQYVFLPEDVDHVIAIGDPDNRVSAAGIRGGMAITDLIGFLTTQGTLRQLIDHGTWAQNRVLTSVGTIAVNSTNAGDTTQIVRVRGYDSDSVLMSEDIALSGTSSVPSAISYRAGLAILSISLPDTDLQGFVKVTQGPLFARLSPDEHSVQHKVVRLVPRSDSAKTLLVVYEAELPSMRDDGDVPLIPVSQYLIEMGKADIYLHQRKGNLAQVHERRAEKFLNDLIAKKTMASTEVYQAVPQGGSWSNWATNGRIIIPPQRPD